MAMPLSRRSLFRGIGNGALLATLSPGLRVALGATSQNILIFVFMRGGMDGLNLVCPADDPDLILARPATLRLATSGSGAGLQLANGPAARDWRLHPSAPELKALYDAGHLAFIHATGNPANSRSHFDMQSMIEAGTADPLVTDPSSGWLGRLATAQNVGARNFASVAGRQALPASLRGAVAATSISNISQFTLGAASRANFLTAAYAGAPGLIGTQGRAAIAAASSLGQIAGKVPVAAYPNNELGNGLAVLSQLIKSGVGLSVAETEFSDWDTHVNQQPRFLNSVSNLSKCLYTFYNDVSAYTKNMTIVVMSEFGRRVKSNADLGTDHGHGNVMMVLGGAVHGKKIYGPWKGLNPSVLDLGDVPVLTDYRSVLSEVVASMNGSISSSIFPKYAAPARLGLFG